MVVYKIPITPQWTLTGSFVTTPDGGLIYIGCNSINYIGPITDKRIAAEIKTINTRQNIVCLDIDPGWAVEPSETSKKYVALVAQDFSLQIWDFDLKYAISGHKVHQSIQGIIGTAQGGGHGKADYAKYHNIPLLSYMKNRNVLSVDTESIVNYCVASNTYQKLPNFIRKRNIAFTQLRCSPYDEEMFAIGNVRGSIYLCNLQKMQVLYTLHGHDTKITSLKFMCTETYSLEQLNQQIHAQHQRQNQQHDLAEQKQLKQQKQHTEGQKNPKLKQLKVGVPSASAKKPTNAGAAAENDDIFDIYDYDYLENEFGAPPKQSDEVSDFVGFQKPQPTAEFDFAEACLNLKSELTAMSIDDEIPDVADAAGEEVTLDDCKNTNVRCDDTSSCDEDDGDFDREKEELDDDGDGDTSLEMIDNRSKSSDEGIGGEDSKKQICLQADVHAVEEKDPTPEHGIDALSNYAECGEDNDGTTLAKPDSKSDIHISDILLASSSMDGKIWLWNVRSGASCDNVQLRSTDKRGGCYVHLSWLNSNKLVATNKSGDLCCFTLETPQVHNIKQRYKLKAFKHSFYAHGVVSFETCQSKELIWCVNRNREISLENFKSKTVLGKFGTLSTNIKSMRENPHDMNKIALGLSDRRVCVIDISKLEANNIHIENYSLRIESLIHSLAWSPDGSKLAFGTEEGRVGIIQVPRTRADSPLYLDSIAGHGVYSMDWHENELFVVCNDIIGIYADNGRKKHASVIENIKKASCISVRSPGYLFVGTRTGKLEIYNRKHTAYIDSYELVQTIDLAPRYITDISFSSIAANLFVVVANANHVHVLNFDNETGKAVQLHKLPCLESTKSSQVSVRWSHVHANKFVTCGFDGGVRVWNLDMEGEKKYEFLKYYPCTVVCGMFMPTDENILLCCGKTTSLEMIDYHKMKQKYGVKRYYDPFFRVQWGSQAMICTKLSATEAKRLKRQKATATDSAPAKALPSNCGTNDAPNNGAQADVVIVNDQLKHLHIVSDVSVANTVLKDAGGIYHKNPVSILCLITKEMNKFPVEKLTQLIKAKTVEGEDNNVATILSAKLFGSKQQAKQLLLDELDNHKNAASQGIQHLFLPQLTQNLKEEILKAITQKRLNEWLVSLAPSVSYTFWQNTTQAFAEQLFEQGYALQAATYMISLHKQAEAIKMLVDSQYFKEAMLVARIYVEKDDPVLVSILEKWLEFLESKGCLFTAAFICALANDMQRSLEFISKVANRTDEINNVIQLITALKSKQANNI